MNVLRVGAVTPWKSALLAGLLALSCGTSARHPIPAVTRLGLPEGWSQEELFAIPGTDPSLEVLDATPEHLLVRDGSYYKGESPGVGIARRELGAWRVRFPGLRRICRASGGDCTSVACGVETRDGLALTLGLASGSTTRPEGRRSYLFRTGHEAPLEVPLRICARPVVPVDIVRCPELRDVAPREEVRYQAVELRRGDRHEIHAIITAGERSAGPAALRYFRCLPDEERTEIFELAPRVSSAKLAIRDGAPLVAFVNHTSERVALHVAHPGAAASKPEDARVLDALDACARIRIEYGKVLPDRDPLLDDNEAECALLLRDPWTRAEAMAVADARCSADDARACWLSGSLRTQFRHRIHLRGEQGSWKLSQDFLVAVKDHESTRFEAEPFFERACKLDDEDGCTQWLLTLRRDRAMPEADALCARKNAFACELARLRAFSP